MLRPNIRPILSLLLTLTSSGATLNELQKTGMAIRHGQAAAAPRPASYRRALQKRQATRSSILARQRRGPAKRQEASPVPFDVCADSNPDGTETYAVFTDGYPQDFVTLEQGTVGSQQECNVACSANFPE